MSQQYQLPATDSRILETIRQSLSLLLDRYRMIEAITAGLGADPEAKELAEALRLRTELLMDIEAETGKLDSFDGKWRSKATVDTVLSRFLVDIEKSIRLIASNDSFLVNCVKRRMDAIEEELMNLSFSSHAAKAYATHGAYAPSQTRVAY